jgi:hypothetical protein
LERVEKARILLTDGELRKKYDAGREKTALELQIAGGVGGRKLYVSRGKRDVNVDVMARQKERDRRIIMR